MLAVISLQLGPQPPDVDPDVLGLRLIAVAPYPPQQVSVGQMAITGGAGSGAEAGRVLRNVAVILASSSSMLNGLVM